EGYNEYKGVVTIQDAGPTVRINLVEQEAEVDSDDTDSSSNITTDSDSSSSTATTKTDSEHKITVSAPVGAAVYIDGTYKGVAPCSFDKIIGEVTLTLTKENYTTKSYSVKIVDDSKDVSWSFPDLEKSSD
ncbi:MAG: PEGA domain-containing protein, partial [Eubacterium sp.]|nr:PEGA domain-containing protein [Eubacterium sp.]